MDHAGIHSSKVLFQTGKNGFLSPILLLVTAVCFLWYIHYKRWAKYSNIPGPTPLPFIGNLHEFFAPEIDVLRTLTKFTKRFNGFTKIWMGLNPLVLITNPEHLQTYYTNMTMIDRPDLYDHMAELLGKDNTFCANGKQWKKMRRTMFMSFNAMPHETFLKNFLRIQKELIESLRSKADGSTFPCNKIFKAALTKAIILSTTNYTIAENTLDELVNLMGNMMRMNYTRQFTIHQRYDWLFYLLPSGRLYRKQFIFCKNVVSEIVDEKFSEMQRMVKNGDPIPNLYIFNMFEKFSDLPLDMVKSELINVLIAGLDTAANTLSFTLLACGLFPEIQQKIYEEDRDIMESLAGNELQLADLERYQYLDRVIKEILRVFPVAPMIARKLGEDTYFGDNLVPKGTSVGVLNWMAYVNPDQFSDPLKFDPDRFLPENVAKRHPYAFNPFSAGARSCPGNRYAIIGIKTIASGIFREFVIKPHYSCLDDLRANIMAEMTLIDKKGFPIKVLPRTVA